MGGANNMYVNDGYNDRNKMCPVIISYMLIHSQKKYLEIRETMLKHFLRRVNNEE